MPDLTPLWLFDLDNTLHNASHAIFPAIHGNMQAYMAQVMGDGVNPADPERVAAARLLYWRRYGATLLGMVRHHAVNAADFLHAAHQFDNLPAMIRAERGLGNLLKRLPGRKILLTNAPRRYSRQVVRHLGLQRHFDRHIAIESMQVHGKLCPKPSRPMLRRLLAREGVRAGRCILVEDTAVNLKAAKTLGLHTVLVTQYLRLASAATVAPGNFAQRNTKRPAYIDVKVKSVRQLAACLHRLR